MGEPGDSVHTRRVATLPLVQSRDDNYNPGVERGSMVYKWCSVVNRGGMEGCVVYRGTEDTVVNWGSVEGVGMGMGGNSDIAFGTKGFMGVLVGYAGVMAFVLVG